MSVVGTEGAQLAARREAMMVHFTKWAAETKLPLSWLLAISRKETNFRNIRSAPGAADDRLGGAFGPMQVTSETARVLGYMPKLSLVVRGQRILADPSVGIMLGAHLLARDAQRLLALKPGTVQFDGFAALACAYNCGVGRVLQGKIPRTTAEKYCPAACAYQQEYAVLDGPPANGTPC